MMIEWGKISLILLAIVGLLGTLKIVDNKHKMDKEIKRKIFHMSMGIVISMFPFVFESAYSVGVLGICSIVLLNIFRMKKFKSNMGNALYSVERKSFGESYFAIAMFLIFYLSKGDIALYIIPMLILTFSDTVAALIGKSYGKKKVTRLNEDAKSLEGTMSFFVVSFIITLIGLLLFTTVGRIEMLLIALIIGFNVAVIEMISHTGNDNVFIPLTTYAFLATHINMGIETLIQNLCIIVGLLVFGAIANRINKMTKVAIFECLVIAYLTITLYSWYAVILPVLLFVFALRLPKITDKEKKVVYDARIIETNILLGISICAVSAVTGLKQELFMLYTSIYSMHLAVNTFVRLKYFFNFKTMDNILVSFGKAFLIMFFPGLVLNKVIFGSIPDIKFIIMYAILMFCSIIAIYFKKKNVEVEKTTVKNGYMHMYIVLACSLVGAIIQFGIFK